MAIRFPSPRLLLREFLPEDALPLYQLNADPEVLRFTGDVPFKSVKEAQNFITNYDAYQKNGFGRWAAIRKKDSNFIGWCGLKLNEEGLIDLGFRFFREEWGKGYATETAKACLEYGFKTLQINQIVGRCDVSNVASIRVLEKIGMRFWKYGSVSGFQEAVYYRKMNPSSYYNL